ncbi:MobH family relaxase [Achromobacter pestifer]|uniref:TraI domain-containing protein n=1 Tax=Achromobacter pestifer TaxID=1353889 RepID=A0A6S6YVT5_9BURK|nr:MobH family relaxase [Achromobacter pestifer]CAB3647542.1 hypothetical protein LMG3431_02578 [Achromobacter pestifer]
MFTLFQRKAAARAPAPPMDAAAKGKGPLRPEPAAALLATPRRQRLLEHIWQRTSLSRKQFKALYLAPLERYAELVQQFPASESHHHAYPGGMLDHGLEIVAYALKLRQSHLLPAGATPEDQAAQAEAWTAAAAYAALLHDIGKIAVDLHVELADGTTWHPWHGPMQRPYRFRYRTDREYRLHSAATGLLYHQLLDPAIFDWLSGYPALWSALLYVLAGQYEHAGTLGELVRQADRASVAQALGGDPAKAMAAPKHALQRKLLDGLRYLLKEELKINQPQASDGWLTQEALWLVSKTVSDKLRAHLLSQGIDGIPASNTAVFNVLQDHGMLQPTPEGKAIWRATISSDTGWSHSFTLLKLSPALIWESSERPEPFAGSVVAETESTSEAADALGPAPQAAASLETAMARETTPPRLSPTAPSGPSPTAPTGPPDVMEDLLSMIGANSPSDTGPHALVPTGTASVPPTPREPSIVRPETGPLPPSAPAPGASPTPASPATASAADAPAAPTGPAAAPSGEDFLGWLRDGVQGRKLVINDARALVHTVSDTVYLVSPGIFQRYVQERPQIAMLAKQEDLPEWRWVQKRFEKLQLHRKQASGLNIWTCDVTGPRKTRRVHGYLLETPSTIFSDVPPNNPYLSLIRTI